MFSLNSTSCLFTLLHCNINVEYTGNMWHKDICIGKQKWKRNQILYINSSVHLLLKMGKWCKKMKMEENWKNVGASAIPVSPWKNSSGIWCSFQSFEVLGVTLHCMRSRDGSRAFHSSLYESGIMGTSWIEFRSYTWYGERAGHSFPMHMYFCTCFKTFWSQRTVRYLKCDYTQGRHNKTLDNQQLIIYSGSEIQLKSLVSF